jgi:twitching motility protein PilT
MHIQELLSVMVEKRASDIHIKVGRPPLLRVNGSLQPMEMAALTEAQVVDLAKQILTERQLQNFDLKNEIDTAYNWEGVARFRANIFRQKSSTSMVMRIIPANIPSLEELDVPDVYRKVATSERGLVLVTGATGSGKSTSLAAMIHEINATSAEHIVTIEDPIEFVHKDKMSSVCQREVGLDTETFSSALRYLLRQDPDVILVGEMRDTETVRAAVSAAETGHMVFSTLHTMDAVQTLDRILDFFPSEQQPQIRQQLAVALKAVICQRLVLRADGTGRIPAAEVLIVTPVIRAMILENRFKNIGQYIKDGDQVGMMSFDQCLIKLYRAGKITKEVALSNASSPAEIELALKGITTSRASAQSMLDGMSAEQNKADVEKGLKRGTDFFKKGMIEEATLEFKKVLRDAPENREAKAYLDQIQGKNDNQALAGQVRQVLRKGLELYQEDKIDEAITVWEEALKLDPASSQAKAYIKGAQDRKVSLARSQTLLASGTQAYQSGDLTSAVHLWEQALQADPHNEQIEQYLEEGRKQVRKRDAEIEAKQHFVTGANFYQAGQVMEAGREWAWALKILPEYQEAAEYLAQAKAFQVAQVLPDLDAASPEAATVNANFQAGADHYMSLRFKDAAGMFSQAKAKLPTLGSLNQLLETTKARQREFLDSFLAKGKLALDAGNIQEAVTQWKLALKEAPDDAVARQAMAAAKPAIQAEVERLYLEGSEAFNANHYKDAIAAFNRVIHLDPSHENAFKKKEEAQEKQEKIKGILTQIKS